MFPYFQTAVMSKIGIATSLTVSVIVTVCVCVCVCVWVGVGGGLDTQRGTPLPKEQRIISHIYAHVYKQNQMHEYKVCRNFLCSVQTLDLNKTHNKFLQIYAKDQNREDLLNGVAFLPV